MIENVPGSGQWSIDDREAALDAREARLAERESKVALTNLHFTVAVEHLPFGFSLFDSDMRMIMCNAKYIEMYRLSPDEVKPGASGIEIAAARARAGTSPKDEQPGDFIRDRSQIPINEGMVISDRELMDGRICSVIRQPLPGGGWVALHEDVTAKRETERKIAFLAHNDVLTGLANRVRLSDHLRQALGRMRRREDRLAVLCLDLDHFKNVNDTLGHPVGDRLLTAVAERLKTCVRNGDMVARTGGDEFAIIQADADQPMAASALSERVIAALSAPFDLGAHQVVIGTTVGIALAPTDGADVDALMKNADLALYRAKSSGRGSYCFFAAEMDAKAQRRRLLELDLRKAVAANEFALYYQPIINLQEDCIVGFEALLRWIHPERGVISPDDFIPLAEETGLIVQIGEWAVKQACREARSWPGNLRVAVNVSPVQFRSKALAVAVIAALAESGLPAHRLELEITEAVLLQNSEATLAMLHELRGIGVRIAMDDFGTGYSSLGYLRSFPFDKIKIDQSFVRDIKHKPESIAIIRAVTGLGASFGMTTTAEGVESQHELEKMRSEGCTEVQGYFLGRPTPSKDILGVLRAYAELVKAA